MDTGLFKNEVILKWDEVIIVMIYYFIHRSVMWWGYSPHVWGICHVMRLLTSCMRYLSCDEVTHLMYEVSVMWWGYSPHVWGICHVMRLLTSCMRYLSRDDSDVGNSWTGAGCREHKLLDALGELSRSVTGGGSSGLSFNTVKRRHYHQQNLINRVVREYYTAYLGWPLCQFRL